MVANLIHDVIRALPLFANLATVLGIYFLATQIALNRKATQCHLINDLEKEFADYYGVFARLKPGGAWRDEAFLSHEEVAELENLVSFCEKLKHFHDRGVLDWRTLDLMFRNRFFTIMDNLNVRTLVIDPCRNDWESVMELEKRWRQKLSKSDLRR